MDYMDWNLGLSKHTEPLDEKLRFNWSGLVGTYLLEPTGLIRYRAIQAEVVCESSGIRTRSVGPISMFSHCKLLNIYAYLTSH